MYVTAEEFRADPVVQTTEAKIGNDDLDSLIERASRYFDLLCGVSPEHFEPAGATATARVFYGNGTNYLKLDPYVTGSLNSTITLPDGYTVPEFTERDGYLVRSESGLLPASYWRTLWDDGVPITVTARWGFEATPADVKLAIIELGINLIRTLDPAETNLTDLERQPLREKAPPRVMMIAKNYQMKEGALV